ncbi:MAG: hypothetical protein GY895_08575, partial [Phycisphaera sp.]|nr:hypothetical protein [Phycisphaera sp.]
MSPNLNRTTLASLIVVAITTPAAFATEADIDREVELLREEIARYRAGRRGSEIDDDRRLMIEQSIDLMLADLSPANDGITGSTTSDTAGWDGSPGWRTADGDFSLFFSAQVQVRFVMNRRRGDEPLPDNPSGTVQGIENRRTRLVFEGTVVDPSWAYRIQGAYSRSGGNFFLEDTWVRKSLGNGVAVQVGQFKPPFLREDLVSSRRLLAVERTAVCDFFRQAWAQGIQASFISDEIRAAGWFGDGIGPKGFGDVRFNSINTPWQNTSTRYSATGRVDWKLAGEWWQFESFNSPRGSPTGIMLGVAGAVQEANQNLGAADGTRVTALTADATF